MGRGVRKVSEAIMQEGRTLIITDPGTSPEDVPAGTVLFDNDKCVLKIKRELETPVDVNDPAGPKEAKHFWEEFHPLKIEFDSRYITFVKMDGTKLFRINMFDEPGQHIGNRYTYGELKAFTYGELKNMKYSMLKQSN